MKSRPHSHPRGSLRGPGAQAGGVLRIERQHDRSDPRRGAFFNYIMVYLTISSVLMTTAGVCLHSVLRADSADRREALFLSSLQRVEHQLRDDTRDYHAAIVSPEELTIASETGASIRWHSNRGIITRTVTESEQPISSDRFVFPAGSLIELVQAAEMQVVVRITEPSAFVTYQASGSGGSNLNKPADESSPPTPAFVAQPKTTEIHLRGIQP